jgi:hypothetical protein
MNSVTAFDSSQMRLDALTDEVQFELKVADIWNDHNVGMAAIHILDQQNV